MEDNLVFAATNMTYKLGRHDDIRIRRSMTDPYIDTSIFIVREATRDEFIKFHEDNNLPYGIQDGDRYYAILMD